MSGVGITGKIEPLNGGAFPVFEDINGQGGLRSVQTIADRNSFSAAPLFCKAGMECYVDDLQCTYALAHDLTTWVLTLPSPLLSLQTDWYVSPTGSDNADGKTLGTPITQDELERRLFPRCTALMMTNDVTVHVAAGAFLRQFFRVANGVEGSSSSTLLIDYEISSSAPMTLTNVVQTAASTRTRGRLTVGAGAGFVYQGRIRLTSGAFAGAVAYSNGLVAANSLDTYVDIFGPTSLAQFHIDLPANIGDTVVTDSLLVQVSRMEIIAEARAHVIVKNARIVRVVVSGASTESPSADNGGNIFFSGCSAISIQGYWQCNAGGACLGACVWEPTTKTVLQGDGWLSLVTCVQGWLGIVGSTSSYGMSIDGGALFIGAEFTTTYSEFSGPGFLATNAGFSGGGSIEVQNGPAPSGFAAVNISPGSVMVIGDVVDCQQWGASTPYSVAYRISPGAYVYQNQPTTGIIADNVAIPSVVNIDAGGETFAYSDNEVFVPNQGCGVLALGSIGADQRSYTDAQFYLTVQSGNQGPTTFSGGNFPASPGMYQVSGYVSTTTADAGAVGAPSLNVIFTDDSGVVRTVAVATAPSVVALGGAGGGVVIESSVPPGDFNAIRWSVTGIVTPGTAKYSLRMRVEKKTSGP